MLPVYYDVLLPIHGQEKEEKGREYFTLVLKLKAVFEAVIRAYSMVERDTKQFGDLYDLRWISERDSLWML